MPKVLCEMPHCIHRSPSGECQAKLIEMMFGMVLRLPSEGMVCFQRCSQHFTILDVEEDDVRPEDDSKRA